MTQKVLITGAGGFIGASLWDFLSKQGYQVIACLKKKIPHSIPKNSRAYKISLPSIEMDQILENEKPDFLVHCAGGASVTQSILDPEKDFHDSVLVSEYLLNSIAKNSPQTKVVFLSSAAVYGNPSKLPIDEKTPTQPISSYGYHKLICELLCEKYHRAYQIPITILRIFSVYGPRLRKQILWDVYQKAKADQTITLFGTGHETRDFVYIDDLTKIIEKTFTESMFSCDKLNVASGCEVTIKDLVRILLEKMHITKPIEFSNQNRLGDPTRWSVNSNLMQELGLSSLPLEIGIEQYVNWLASEES